MGAILPAVILLALATGAALFAYDHGWVPFVLTAGTAALALPSALPPRARPVTPSLTDLVILAFALWLVVTTVTSVSPSRSLDALLLYALLPLGFLAMRTRPESARPLIVGFVSIMTVLALIGLAIGEFGFVFLNKNHMAAMLGIGAMLAFATASTKRGASGVLSALALAVLACAVAASGSRGAYVGSVVALALLAVALFHASVPRGRLLVNAAIVASGAVISTLITSGYSAARFESLAPDAVRVTGAMRLVLWKTAWPLVQERPLTGFGPGMTEYAWSPLRVPVDSTSGYYLHNDYLQFAVDTGVIGALLLVTIAGIMTWALVSTPRTKTSDTTGLAAAAAAVFLFVHTFFDFHLQSAALLLITGALVGVAAGSTNPVCSVNLHRWRVPIATGGIVLVLMGGYLAYQRTLIPGEVSAGPVDAQFRLIKRVELAVRLRPSDVTALRARASIYTTAYGRMGPGHSARGHAYTVASESVERAVASNPLDPYAYHERGRLAAASGAPNAAQRDFRKALELKPHLVESRLALAESLQSSGRPVEALQVLEDGLEWESVRSVAALDHLLQTIALAEQFDRPDIAARARQRLEEFQ